MLSRSEHCFAGQRTSFESPLIVLENAHDTVYYFLRENRVPPVDLDRDLIKIDSGLWSDKDLWFSEERFAPSTKRAAWRSNVEVENLGELLGSGVRTEFTHDL